MSREPRQQNVKWVEVSLEDWYFVSTFGNIDRAFEEWRRFLLFSHIFQEHGITRYFGQKTMQKQPPVYFNCPFCVCHFKDVSES